MPNFSPPAHQHKSSPSANERTRSLVLLGFAVVYLVWGSTYLAMRIGIESFPPLLLAGTRHVFVGVVFYPLLRWKTGIRPTLAHWRTAAITGCLLLVANAGVCVGEETVPSGIAAVLFASVSLWMVLIDWLRPGGSRPVARVAVGLALGFAGLALLVGPAHLGASGRVNPLGATVMVVSALSWAFGSIYSKHGTLPESPLLGVAMQGLCGGIALWILAFLTRETKSLHFGAVSFRSWMALAYLIVFGSAIGFTSYIYILKNSTAARVATYAFVNPVVALFLGWMFAGESVNLRVVLSAAVILTAVLLVITAPHRKPVSESDFPSGVAQA